MTRIVGFAKGFRKGMNDFGTTLTMIVNSILLLIVYIIGVGVTSLVAKLFGKHFLERKIQKHAATYWKKLDLGKKPIDDFYRQF